MRDGASVNGAAVRKVKFFYPDLFHVVCFSHIRDNVGSQFEFQVLDSFVRFWIGLFSHMQLQCQADMERERTGQSIRTFSETGWWSKCEVLFKQALDLFPDVVPFPRENEEIPPANRRHLLEVVDYPEILQELRLELAVLIDARVHFVNATYYLEGDGPLIISCYERLSAVAQAVAVDHYPNTGAVAREIANGDAALFNRLIA